MEEIPLFVVFSHGHSDTAAFQENEVDSCQQELAKEFIVNHARNSLIAVIITLPPSSLLDDNYYI